MMQRKILRPWLVLALALTPVLLGGCSLLGRGGDEAVDPPAELPDFEPEREVERLWQVDIGDGPAAREDGLQLALGGARLFAATPDGKVLALSTETGEQLWRVDLDRRLTGGPAAGLSLVVVGSADGEVFALDPETGEQRWQARVTSEVVAPPAVSPGAVVVRALDGRVTAFTADGEQRWEYRSPVPALTLRGASAPLIEAGVAVIGLDNGRLVGIEIGSGRVLWEQVLSLPSGRSEVERLADVDATPAIRGTEIYAVGYQGRLLNIGLQTGQPRWSRDVSSAIGITASGAMLYVVDDRSRMLALDRLSGGSLWRQEALYRRQLTAPAATGEGAVVGDYEGYLHWLHPADGRPIARYRLDGDGITAPPLVGADRVFALGRGGKLAALRLAAD